MNTLLQNEARYNQCAPLSWTAIFSGLLTSTAVGAIAALLGSAIGLTLFTPDADMINFLNISAVIWFIITGSIAMFIGGWVTGYITPFQSCMKSSMHGFVLWSLSFLLGFVLSVGSAGMVLTGSAQLVGKALSISQETVAAVAKPVANAVSTAVDNGALDKISDQVGSLMKKTDKNNKNNGVDSILQSNDANQEEVMSKIGDYLANPNKDDQQLHNDMITVLTQNTSLSQQQAEKVLTKWEDSYDKAAQKAKDKAQEVKDNAKEAVQYGTDVMGGVTFAAVLAMLIGLIATILGSFLGARYSKNRLD